MKESGQAAARCPLCEGENRCAMAAGQNAARCWCQTVAISAAARDLAAASADERCLCPVCGAPTDKVVKQTAEVASAR